MLDYLFVSFNGEAFKFLDSRFGKVDPLGHQFFLRAPGKVIVERNGRLIFTLFDHRRVLQIFGKVLVLHQLPNKSLALGRPHRLKRCPKNFRCCLWLSHNVGIIAQNKQTPRGQAAGREAGPRTQHRGIAASLRIARSALDCDFAGGPVLSIGILPKVRPDSTLVRPNN